MAIDSAAKRASALYFVRHRKGRLIPDGTIAGVDFLDAVGFYRGIAASAVVVSVGIFTTVEIATSYSAEEIETSYSAAEIATSYSAKEQL